MPENEDIMPNRPEPTESRGMLVENLGLKLTTVGAGVGLLVFVVAWLVNLRYDVNVMRTDIVQIKQTVQAFSRIESLDVRLNEIRQYGSDTARRCEREINALRKDFEMHTAITAPK